MRRARGHHAGLPREPGRRSREDFALQPQLLVLTAEAGQLVSLRRSQGDIGRRRLRLSSAVQAASVGHPVPDRLSGRLELAGEVLRIAAGTDQM